MHRYHPCGITASGCYMKKMNPTNNFGPDCFLPFGAGGRQAYYVLHPHVAEPAWILKGQEEHALLHGKMQD